MEPLSVRRCFLFSVDADCKLLGQAIHNLFDGTGTDFRPTLEAQRAEIIGPAASAHIDTNDFSGVCFTHTLERKYHEESHLRGRPVRLGPGGW